MDERLTLAAAAESGAPDGDRQTESSEITPPPAPLEMPEQRLDVWESIQTRKREGAFDFNTLLARIFVFGLTAAFTGYGAWEMVEVVGENRATTLQFVFVAMFVLTFVWIALAAANSILGFFTLIARTIKTRHKSEEPLRTRNALVMPVYNEGVGKMTQTLRKMIDELVDAGHGWHFDLFILSDSTDDLVAQRERDMAIRLRRRFYGRFGVYYRRRQPNIGRKPGNLADFVCRWGGDYDHMIVLDADSYMTCGAITTLVRAMESDPRAGLIQTSPTLRQGTTLFARLQQFATSVYGPVIVSGLALWHGRDGNYWGHNAIIRVSAFAACCGLPQLKGRKPFGGHILSHDFVEAALLRRAGWDVYMLPEVRGSYEGSPPSLAEYATRDRRWAQGNLQHSKVLPSAGFHWMSRFHMLNGIIAYAASPFWLAFLAIGFVLALQASLQLPVYFGDERSLFPTWPTFDAERALALTLYSLVILLAPKILGGAGALLDPRLRRGTGGFFALTVSVILEVLMSALLAPIMMLLQTRFVADILLGRESGWEAQQRAGSVTTIATIARRHWLHTVAGLILAVGSFSVTPELFYWLLPVWLGLSLSIPVAFLTSRRDVGSLALKMRLFLIPDEPRRRRVFMLANERAA